MNILTRHEARRGCGFRQPGGKYLISSGYGRHCGALPIELSVCPTCHAGIKPARGWTWVNLAALASVRGCNKEGGCGDCPIADNAIQDVGLIWVGEKFYPTAQSFQEEANTMGISRRISAIPRKFKLGETWVVLAHRKAISRKCPNCTTTSCLINSMDGKPACETCAGAGEIDVAGIFHVFKPIAIEYVVKEDDPQEKLERMEEQGITLVRVVPIEEKAAA
jgi:hypothetical protein